MLVSAAYDPADPSLTLVFDRAVDISAYEGTEIHVDDGSFTGNIRRARGGEFARSVDGANYPRRSGNDGSCCGLSQRE
jgi:hypothetical protein